jgi:D-glycero-alpha-D-manno-heptose 1-phosphate guanylyltransferase
MKNLSDITAAILAGGLGTRLRSAIPDRPKVLAEVGGRPFIVYLLDQLAAAGIQEVVLCTGYLGHQVKEVLGQTHGPLSLIYSQESSPLGTGGALRLALPIFLTDQVLILNGDSFCDANLRALALIHRLRRAKATILLVEVSDNGRFGWVNVDAGGAIQEFLEKGSKRGPGWINAGIYLIDRSLLRTIPPNQKVSLEQESFPAWVGQGLYGFRSHGRLVDIGTPESFALAQDFFHQEIQA